MRGSGGAAHSDEVGAQVLVGRSRGHARASGIGSRLPQRAPRRPRSRSRREAGAIRWARHLSKSGGSVVAIATPRRDRSASLARLDGRPGVGRGILESCRLPRVPSLDARAVADRSHRSRGSLVRRRAGRPVHRIRLPMRASVRDYSRVVPLADQPGEVIGWEGGIAVALKRRVGMGTLVYLGSPLGPALWADDQQARRLLLQLLAT